ncbi:MAG: site-specific integrase [Alphaproteobacteria bacterium]|nr:site-specific integrase [Candidatus Fonsibacter sp. PEL55]
MATIRRRNNKWQVIIRKDNFKIIYKTFILKEDAHRWARDTEVKIEQGLYQDLTLAKITKLKDILIQYRDRVSVNKKGYENERYKINKIIRSDIADKTLSELTSLVLFEFIEQQKKLYTASTINKSITIINLALKFAERFLGITLNKNPLKFIKRLKESNFIGQVIEPHEEVLLLKHAEFSKLYWLKTAIILGIDCGLRRGEILKLKAEDINFKNSTAVLRDTKNGETREIGLSQRAIQEIKKLPITIDGKLFPCKRLDTFSFYYNQLQRWSGVKKRFHDTRHTFASRKATQGWSITEIAAQGGWKQLQVLKRYTHIKAEYLAKKMN